MDKKDTSVKKLLLVALGVGALVPSVGFAAGAGAGVDASFATLYTDLETMLAGNAASVIVLVGLVIGVAVYAFTASWRFMISAILVAFFIGYGLDILTGVSAVTASTDMLANSDPIPLDAEPAAGAAYDLSAPLAI